MSELWLVLGGVLKVGAGNRECHRLGLGSGIGTGFEAWDPGESPPLQMVNPDGVARDNYSSGKTEAVIRNPVL